MNNGARRLGAWRARRGYTQVEAAARLRVLQSNYSRYERGAGKPGRSTALDIARRTRGAVPAELWDQGEDDGDGVGAA